MPRFRVTAPKPVVDELRALLETGVVSGVDHVSTPTAAKVGITDRAPLGQVELWDIVIGFAGGVGSNAAYDALKALVTKFRDVRRVADEPPSDSGAAADS